MASVVGEEVVAGEIEIDQARHLVAEEEHVVGEQIGVDHAGGQARRPMLLEKRQLGFQFPRQSRLHFVRARGAFLEQVSPAGHGKIVGAVVVIVARRGVQPREGVAQRPAMRQPHPALRNADQEGDERRRPPAQFAQRLAVAAVDRGGAGDALGGEVVHQAEEEGQVVRRHPLFVEGQDEAAAVGFEEVVGVLHPFGDALIGQQFPDIVFGQESLEGVVVDFGIDGHEAETGHGGGWAGGRTISPSPREGEGASCRGGRRIPVCVPVHPMPPLKSGRRGHYGASHLNPGEFKG